MNILANKTIVFWYQLHLIILAKQSERILPDPCLNTQLCVNGKRLEKSLHAAIDLGLWNAAVKPQGATKNENYYVYYHNRFTSSLADVIHSAETNATGDQFAWCNDDIVTGVVRLIDSVSRYTRLDGDIKEQIKQCVKDFPTFGQEKHCSPVQYAWTYLDGQKEGTPGY